MRARRLYQYKAICSVCAERGLCEERGRGGRPSKGRESLSVVYVLFCVLNTSSSGLKC